MIAPDPIRQAQREWEKAASHLADCLAHYRRERDRQNPPDTPIGWGDTVVGTLSAAVALAAVYDEERTLFDTYEGLVLDEVLTLK